MIVLFDIERHERERSHHPLPVRGIYWRQALPARMLKVEEEVRHEDRCGSVRKVVPYIGNGDNPDGRLTVG